VAANFYFKFPTNSPFDFKLPILGATNLQLDNTPFSTRYASLQKFFVRELYNVTVNLAKSGSNLAKQSLRDAKTPWGESRMAGNHFGVRFRPYGRSSGREDTGFMYDSISWDVVRGGKNTWKATFGYTEQIINNNSYIRYQLSPGFVSTGAFDARATAAAGVAKFKQGPQKFVEGANLFGYRSLAVVSLKRRQRAAYSAAWKEAVKKWKAAGYKGEPESFEEAVPKPKTGYRRK